MGETNTLKQKKTWTGISSFTLHILAMIFMTCDHLWATVVPGNQWLTCVGRLTFPIYAFLIAEGYHYTKDFKKYILRLLVFALISEIPFNLMYGGDIFYPFHQNVLWNFILSLLCLRIIDNFKKKKNIVIAFILSALVVGAFMLIAQLTFLDYYGEGLLMVVLFHVCRGNKWYHKLLQFAGLVIINCYMMKGLTIPFTLFGHEFEFVQQAFAIFSIIPILLYKGKQGPRNKFTKYLFYAYYPLHTLILGLMAMNN